MISVNLYLRSRERDSQYQPNLGVIKSKKKRNRFDATFGSEKNIAGAIKYFYQIKFT